MMNRQMLRTVSLYTGVGGLDYGFEAAGFSTAVAVELDASACSTLRLNRKWCVLEGNIHNLTSRTILGCAECEPGDVDVLVGGPPCQPFSKSGYWKLGDSRRLLDPRADTLQAYLRVLGDIRPRAFVLENVPGLGFTEKDEGLRYLFSGIERINRRSQTRYSVSCFRVNAAHYGVPQLRERLFLIGFRDGRPFREPPITHAASPLKGTGLLPYTTSWDAIGDLDVIAPCEELLPTGKWRDLLPSIPEGQNYLWHTSRGGGKRLFGWRTRYWSFLLKLAKSKPSWTIQAQPGPATGPFHWRNRRLSLRELCRLQTLPDNLRFECGIRDAQRLIGNAVPSLLAEVLAREIRAQLLGRQPRRGRPTLAVSHRGTPPAPEPVRPVPARFLNSRESVSDHPGEGKGRGAVARQNSPHRSRMTST